MPEIDDITNASLRRVMRSQAQLQRKLRADGMELAQVIAISMVTDVACTLISEVGVEPTEKFLHACNGLFAEFAALTDLEWAAQTPDQTGARWSDLAVTFLGPHLDDEDEARHVGLMMSDIMWYLGDLPQTTPDWVTTLVKRVSSYQ